MKLRKNLLIILVLLLVLAASLAGALFAYMYKQTEEVTNTFVPAQVACVVNEDFNGEEKSNITVTNTGNIDAYLRVRLVSYWVDDAGNIMPVASVMPSFTLKDGWIELGNDTYCYTLPVAPNHSTAVLASGMTLGDDEKGYKQVVEVFAEAIQAKPAGAVESAWTVVGVNQDGNLYKKS